MNDPWIKKIHGHLYFQCDISGDNIEKMGELKVSKFNYKNTMFMRIIISYLSILLVPIFIGIIAGNFLFDFIEDEVKRGNRSMLTQCMEITDGHFKQLDTIVLQVSQNNDLNRIVQENKLNYYQVSLLLKQLSSLMIPNEFINEYYIYLENTDYILTGLTCYPSSFFYEHSFNYKELDYPTWRQGLMKNRVYGEVWPAKEVGGSEIFKGKKMISYLYSLPLEYMKDNKGSFVMLINEEKLKKHLSHVGILDGGWVYILGQDDELITTMSKEDIELPIEELPELEGNGTMITTIGDKEMMVIYTTSTYNDWTYVSVVPTEYIFAPVKKVRKISWTIALITLIGGGVIAHLLAHRQMRPVHTILALLKDSPEKNADKVSYESIKSGISQLVINNKSMQEAMESQEELIRQDFFKRLIRGDYMESSNLDSIMSYLGLRIRGDLFVVLFMRINYLELDINETTLAEDSMVRVVAKEQGNRYFKELVCTYDVDESSVAFMLAFNADEISLDQLHTQASDYVESLLLDYKINCIVGIGNIVNTLMDINRSFEQAREALSYSMRQESVLVMTYLHLPLQHDLYYYPMELELRLSNYTKAGNLEDVHRLLEVVYYENLSVRNLSREVLGQLYNEIYGSLLKLTTHIELDDDMDKEIRELEYKPFNKESFQQFKLSFAKLCEIVQQRKKSHNKKVIDNILAYIDEHFYMKDMSLTVIANAFGYTEGYLSQFFKEQTGTGFSNYLTEIRMTRACQLIKETGLTMNEIAERVGYNSAQVFRRAFKRVKGISPSELRKKQKLLVEEIEVTE